MLQKKTWKRPSDHCHLPLGNSPDPDDRSSKMPLREAFLTSEDEQLLSLLEGRRDHHFTQLPQLSGFRVLALVAYEDLDGQTLDKFVIGANAECVNIGGATCAERAAMAQLQLLPVRRVRSIYIVSDSAQCLTPGTLCREFLLSSPFVTPDTHFVTRATSCRPCVTTLRELYPFPSLYNELPRAQVLPFARNFTALKATERDVSRRPFPLEVCGRHPLLGRTSESHVAAQNSRVWQLLGRCFQVHSVRRGETTSAARVFDPSGPVRHFARPVRTCTSLFLRVRVRGRARAGARSSWGPSPRSYGHFGCRFSGLYRHFHCYDEVRGLALEVSGVAEMILLLRPRTAFMRVWMSTRIC